MELRKIRSETSIEIPSRTTIKISNLREFSEQNFKELLEKFLVEFSENNMEELLEELRGTPESPRGYPNESPRRNFRINF